MNVSGDVWMDIDLDNFERVTGIEILAPTSEMAACLSCLHDPSHRRATEH